ncbi:Ketosteroid isomerase-related protein [Lentzea albidocapillata subsp. violacea]|uniref:Ketosteroid isomerase-related protein n=1 Tax=Lentzea albidocapillata subsp. violacea TaxID=128104 RepID=A0A1G8SET8_9PSEU|nr:nuclear transport factor 2 family protein [Lentzea albidocapillata]SDJ27707.1 Ketosteroid isomerase-related protein [Lentzea albidocapillata subsp. violacea]
MSTAAGVDHVRLSYEYLDMGDLDGYASLLHPDMQLKRRDAPPGHGRDHTVRLLTTIPALRGRHHIHKVVAGKDTVVVVGRYTPPPEAECRTPSEFADVVTLSDEGLLLCNRRFYYDDPPSL